MANLTINQELNGIEIKFENKPEAATLDALKANGFRWHRVKKVWYAKQTADRLEIAQQITGGQITEAKKATKADKINLDGLGENRPENFYNGAELAKAIREDLKARGVSGVTVRARRITYDTGITVTVKATPEDFASIEEAAERYSLSNFSCAVQSGHGIYCGGRWLYGSEWETMTDEAKQEAHRLYITESIEKVSGVQFGYSWPERSRYWEFTSKFWEKLTAIYKIANQWNYCNDDIMTDYFERGYYLDIDIKKADDFAPRQDMTEEEREAYAAEIKEEQEAREAAFEQWKKEEAERQEEAKRREEQRRQDVHTIAEAVTVEDLEESDRVYISNLSGGYGKESTLAELDEVLNERGGMREDAVISRVVRFKSREAFDLFGRYLLEDFGFLAGMGGTASEDVRLADVPSFSAMNAEQRDSVKWYLCACVAVYVGKSLELVIDPQGFDYARYCYRLTDASKITPAKEELDTQRTASEQLTPFYFPAPVAEQVKNIKDGEAVTVYQSDGWGLSIYGGAGVVLSVDPGNYVQYSGQWITFTNGKSVFIRDGKRCLIYKGIKPTLPDHLTKKQIDDNMFMLLNAGELFPRILEHYGEQGEEPIVDTVQR